MSRNMKNRIGALLKCTKLYQRFLPLRIEPRLPTCSHHPRAINPAQACICFPLHLMFVIFANDMHWVRIPAKAHVLKDLLTSLWGYWKEVKPLASGVQ